MIIDLASVGRDPKQLEANFSPEQIELDETTRLVEDATFEGEVARGSDERTTIRGHLSAKVTSDCARCLEPVEVPVEVVFEDIFADESAEPSQEEIELQAGDLDESLISGREIDLADVVREQIILATDEPALCKEDCRGLCATCGTNRNLEDCECADEDIDPRWAALKNLN